MTKMCLRMIVLASFIMFLAVCAVGQGWCTDLLQSTSCLFMRLGFRLDCVRCVFWPTLPVMMTRISRHQQLLPMVAVIELNEDLVVAWRLLIGLTFGSPAWHVFGLWSGLSAAVWTMVVSSEWAGLHCCINNDHERSGFSYWLVVLFW